RNAASAPCARQRLLQALDARPRIVLEPLQALADVVEAELIAGAHLRQLPPGQGSCDRRARAVAQRVRAHRGRAAAVTQVVDENLPRALRLGGDRDVALRALGGEAFRERAREAAHRVPAAGGLERDDHVQALAARGAYE